MNRAIKLLNLKKKWLNNKLAACVE